MNFVKLTLILTLLGILILTFISQSKTIQIGTIDTVQTSQNKITIHLKNHATELIIFGTPYLNLKPDDRIKFQGKLDTYKNQKQIIVSKISVLKKD